MAFKFECLIERFLSSISQCIHWPLVVIYVRLAEILTRPLVSWRKTCQQGMIWSLGFYSIQLHLVQTDHKDMTFMICYLFRTSKGCLCSCPIPHSFLYLSSFWSVLNSRSHCYLDVSKLFSNPEISSNQFLSLHVRPNIVPHVKRPTLIWNLTKGVP